MLPLKILLQYLLQLQLAVWCSIPFWSIYRTLKRFYVFRQVLCIRGIFWSYNFKNLRFLRESRICFFDEFWLHQLNKSYWPVLLWKSSRLFRLNWQIILAIFLCKMVIRFKNSHRCNLKIHSITRLKWSIFKVRYLMDAWRFCHR